MQVVQALVGSLKPHGKFGNTFLIVAVLANFLGFTKYRLIMSLCSSSLLICPLYRSRRLVTSVFVQVPPRKLKTPSVPAEDDLHCPNFPRKRSR
jgi:hypothetical protein